MSRTPWYEDDNPTRVARGASWRIAVWVVCIVLLVGVLTAGVWAVKVAVSGPKGAGDAARIKNNGTNRVQVQQEFNQRYQDILSADRRITVAYDELQADKTDSVLRTRYAGARSYCQGAVGEYNAAARTYTKADFRDADLPAVIDNTDPTTDCREEPQR
jgi:hypothetical protein